MIARQPAIWVTLIKITAVLSEMRIHETSSSFNKPSLSLPHECLPQTTTLHTLSPYIGKMRPEIAAWAIDKVSSPGDLIYDPFCGSGTVLLEGWVAGRNVIGTDLNPYAWLITQAKLNPYQNLSEDFIQGLLETYMTEVSLHKKNISLDKIDPWISGFYHPDTLHELLAWIDVLSTHRDAFALSCLLGIAHHQRPGFLSYPSSNLIPYLRTNKYPEKQFPEMYTYREIFPRLKKKIIRACSRLPNLDYSISRSVELCDAAELSSDNTVDAIITSPPYMGQLDYARDNRLRLGLLGINDIHGLNRDLSPRAARFTEKMDEWLEAWQKILKPNGKLALLVGDTTNTTRKRLDLLVLDLIAHKWPTYKLVDRFVSDIPDARRSRKNCKGSLSESLLVFELKP